VPVRIPSGPGQRNGHCSRINRECGDKMPDAGIAAGRDGTAVVTADGPITTAYREGRPGRASSSFRARVLPRAAFGSPAGRCASAGHSVSAGLEPEIRPTGARPPTGVCETCTPCMDSTGRRTQWAVLGIPGVRERHGLNSGEYSVAGLSAYSPPTGNRRIWRRRGGTVLSPCRPETGSSTHSPDSAKQRPSPPRGRPARFRTTGRGP